MKLSVSLAILAAVVAWIVLYVIIGIPLWIAFVAAAAILVVSAVGAGTAQRTSH